MSVEHILGLVESDHDVEIFCNFATIASQGHVPRGVLERLRLGRVTALRQPHGNIRGIVVGDIIRRLIASTIAQRPRIEERQVARVGQHARWCASSPFVRLFYSAPSTHVWEDELGMIPQKEGGEQGDPLMPLLFSLGQHSAVDAVISLLEEGERLFTYLDDLCVVCDPGRIAEVHSISEEELWRHAPNTNPPGQDEDLEQGWICSSWLGRPRSRRAHDGPQRNRVERQR